MTNKKAQLGKIITTLPVLIILILLMAVFVALSAGAFLFKGKAQPEAVASNVLPEENLFFKTIKINNEKMLVIDSVSLMLGGKITPGEIELALRPLAHQNNACVVLWGDIKVAEKKEEFGSLITGYSYKDGTITKLEAYKWSAIMSSSPDVARTTITLQNQDYEVSSYYGRCLDE